VNKAAVAHVQTDVAEAEEEEIAWAQPAAGNVPARVKLPARVVR
jgi:hypothetical protein